MDSPRIFTTLGPTQAQTNNILELAMDSNNIYMENLQPNFNLQTNDQIPYKELKKCYGTDDDLNELAALLLSWNLPDLYDFFLGKFSNNSEGLNLS